MLEIPLEGKLGKGLVALVDDEDYPILVKYKWYLLKLRKNRYAMADTGGKTIRMHRLVLQDKIPEGFVTDHIDGNGLNNQKSNLRIASKQQNLYNRKPQSANSIYKGLQQLRSGNWTARIKFKGVTYILGTFVREEDAAHAYDEGAKRFFGEFAWLNFR